MKSETCRKIIKFVDKKDLESFFLCILVKDEITDGSLFVAGERMEGIYKYFMKFS